MIGRALLLAGSVAALGCTVGEGQGWIQSDKLYIEDCWNGPFDLNPDFFAAIPYRRETLLMRVQRGDNIEEQSDGMTVLINDLQGLRESDIGVPIEVGLPVGVTPPGMPVIVNPDPPKVSLSIYLHNSCHEQNATIYSISGSITFRSLFNGDPNVSDAADRLTDATFAAQFGDPRQVSADMPSDTLVSQVRGEFRFYFQRGQPAQPFQ